ncbi:hypothetical protein EVAR_31945_1 [Eumeta japonica]|uniref:Uncharacterized protein n=1 Tax=Eumeta variegata TaxID=151549 RepID=A0A4C1WST7_EUMVA|nr:hypothetical protein EVAR_31945_1 [Eumeta japonica]
MVHFRYITPFFVAPPHSSPINSFFPNIYSITTQETGNSTGPTSMCAIGELVCTATHRHLQSQRSKVGVGGREEWATGTLSHWMKFNTESCYFTSVFYESVVLVEPSHFPTAYHFPN